MKVVILAGGLGTRLSEETVTRPKPMVEIGGIPILWHIMKIYSSFGFNDFIICLGYKGSMIKEYFINYYHNKSDITIGLHNNTVEIHNTSSEPFNVTLVETGPDTKTAGRIKQVEKYIGNEEFMLTYGDGVANVDIKALIDFHRSTGKIATMTAVMPESRFGALDIGSDYIVTEFKEKPQDMDHWINGGFFVLKPELFKYLKGDMTEIMWEQQPLNQLTNDRELAVYKHNGFWKCMDSIRDKTELEEMWASGKAKWKIWK